MDAVTPGELSDDDNRFLVSEPGEIALVLNGLAARNIGVSAIFNSGADVLLTDVLGIDSSTDSVFLDINANAERNRQFQAAPRAIFIANADGANIQWSSTGIEEAIFDGRPAFRIPLPKSLRRIQRRNVFRVNTPSAHPVVCHIPIESDQELHLPLIDICIEGIGVVLPHSPDPALQKNAKFANCKIEHDDFHVSGLTLTVKSIWSVPRANGIQVQHAGLEFTGITQSTQDIIQHFVFKLERQKIAQDRRRSG